MLSASKTKQVSNGGYAINSSLRLRSSNSAYLSRTPSSTTDRQKFTISFWMKSDENLNYDLSKAIREHSFSLASEDTKPEGVFFKPDG